MPGFQNPYLNPYGFQQMPTPVYQQPSQQVVKVNGENGAKAFAIGANSSALLLDESGTMVWLVTSDGAGYKTVSAYDIVPHKVEPPVNYGNLESRIKRLEEIVSGRNTADSSAVRKEQYYGNDSAGKADDEHGSYRTESATHAESTRNEQSKVETGNGYRPTEWRGSNEGPSGNGRADGY